MPSARLDGVVRAFQSVGSRRGRWQLVCHTRAAVVCRATRWGGARPACASGADAPPVIRGQAMRFGHPAPHGRSVTRPRGRAGRREAGSGAACITGLSRLPLDSPSQPWRPRSWARSRSCPDPVRHRLPAHPHDSRPGPAAPRSRTRPCSMASRPKPSPPRRLPSTPLPGWAPSPATRPGWPTSRRAPGPTLARAAPRRASCPTEGTATSRTPRCCARLRRHIPARPKQPS